MSPLIRAGRLWLVPIFGLILWPLIEQNSCLAAEGYLEPCPQPGYPTTAGVPAPSHCVNSTGAIRMRKNDWWKWLAKLDRWARPRPPGPLYVDDDYDENLTPPLGQPSSVYDTSLFVVGNPIDLADKCGRAPLNRMFRLNGDDDVSSYVVNGKDSEYGEFPSYVKLEVLWGDYARSYCGGTLISERHVLTAAHCLHHGGKRAKASQLTIILGEHKLAAHDKYQTKEKISRVCIAENFKQDYEVTYDWALLEISRTVEFNDYIQPACLPREPIVTRGRSARCYLVGLGAIGFGKDPGWTGILPSIEPKVVQKLSVEQVPCRGWPIAESDKSRSCYTRAGGKPGDSCQGDSGGPILCLDERGRWTVTASVSYGTKYCNDEGPAAWIGVYANIQKLVGDMDRRCG